MSDKKYVVPEGGLKAAFDAVSSSNGTFLERYALDHIKVKPMVEKALEAFIAWQSENPILPTRDQAFEILQRFKVESNGCHSFRIADALVEWQQIMYLTPEPEVPKSVFDTLYARGTVDGPGCTCVMVEDAVKALREAYRLGQQASSK